MKNLFLEKYNEGKKLTGTLFHLGSASVIECLAGAGLDFVIIDSEHGPAEVENAMEYIRTADLRGITPFVRIKEVSRTAVLKMLDIGAQGIIVPCINSVDEVKKVIEYGKYYPLGQRGVCLGRESIWGNAEWARDMKEYFKVSNRESLIFPQCETLGCLEHIEEVTALDGVAGIFIGPFDLSTALGKPAQFEDPQVKAAISRIIKACNDNGKCCMMLALNTQSARDYFAQGVDAAVMGIDAGILVNAFKNIVEEVYR